MYSIDICVKNLCIEIRRHKGIKFEDRQYARCGDHVLVKEKYFLFECKAYTRNMGRIP